MKGENVEIFIYMTYLFSLIRGSIQQLKWRQSKIKICLNQRKNNEILTFELWVTRAISLFENWISLIWESWQKIQKNDFFDIPFLLAEFEEIIKVEMKVIVSSNFIFIHFNIWLI